jgi:chemotaxis regulatin CheY-phosphate phosphatase CheZ
MAGAFEGARGAAKYIGELTKELRELSDLPLGKLTDEMKQIIAGAKEAVKEVTAARKETDEWMKALKAADDYNKTHTGSHMEVGKLGESFTGVTVLEGRQWLPWGELTKPEQQAGRVDPTKSEAYTKFLQDLTDQMKKVMGPDNYLAQLFEKEIPYLKVGARSAEEVQAFIQSVLMNFMAGLQREMAEPKTPREVRDLLNQLLHLAVTGNALVGGMGEAAKKTVDEVKRLSDMQDKANKFAENIGKGVERIEHSVTTGEATTNTIDLFSRDLERHVIAQLRSGH